jgi:glutamyl-tRNA synthetase
MIKVRFAPSPTGYLHVGGARTALFNWLFARHNEGAFVLRIEDTDRSRSTEESIEEILESMSWLGLKWDEYYRQTDRAGLYQRTAEWLLDRDHVYERDGAWWFQVPRQGETVVEDELLGGVAFNNQQLKDFVIRRSDGNFVYNFAVVVDDIDMGITHVIRGDDHLNNTPKQILLYQALNSPIPKFVHLPMILGPDRARLSKRHGVTAVLDYRRRGFLPEAMVNFFARLGWSYGDQEVFSRRELVELFTLDNLRKSASIFDEEKLLWLNQRHLKEMDPQDILPLVKPFIREGGVSEKMWGEAGQERLLGAIVLLRDRCHTLIDLADVLQIMFPVDLVFEKEPLVNAEQIELLRALIEALDGATGFTPELVEAAIRETVKGKDARLKDVAPICRMVTTGRGVGPGLFELMSLIGREITTSRLQGFVGKVSRD